ncbi:MAG: DUF1207 domain-containing protein [Nevskiales bacterium]
MTHTLRASLLVCCLAPLAAAAEVPGESTDYARGYAQAVLDRQFPKLELSIDDGAKPGRVIVVSKGCLTATQQLAISKVLLGKTIEQVDWQMTCFSAAVTQPPESTIEKETPAKIEVEPLPPGPLFKPLLADPREPRFSVNYQHHRTDALNFDAADVSLGEYVGFVEGDRGNSRYQIGLQGAVFALFNLDSDSFDLINADYLIGFPLTWRRHEWSARTRLYHISSHLGDEFLLGNPGIDRINLSYEVVDALLSHEWKQTRLYGGGVVVHSDPDLDRGLAQFGGEYDWGTIWDGVDLSLGADLKGTAEQDWSVNQSYRAGISFTRSTREVRLMLQHYRGFSPNGQFFTERLRYTGIGLYFGL